MNCIQVREAVDTATRRQGFNETVKSHLGNCADCLRHANETSALLSLLSAQPRVEAPADFDFRLRARIARAKAEPQGQTSLIDRIWARSFSFGQAATAMAAVAVAVTASTFYFKTSEQPVISPMNANVAVTAPARTVELPAAVTGTTAAPIVKATRAMRVSAPAARPAMSVAAESTTMAASSRVYSREMRQVIPDRNLIGAEAASLNTAKAAGYIPSL